MAILSRLRLTNIVTNHHIPLQRDGWFVLPSEKGLIPPPDWTPWPLRPHLTFGCKQQQRGRCIWAGVRYGASISGGPGSSVNKKLIRGLSSSCQVSGALSEIGHRRLVLPWITTSRGSHAGIPLQSHQLGGTGMNASDFGATLQIALTTNLLSSNSVSEASFYQI